MIADYEQPVIQLSSDFGSHSSTVRQVIMSLLKVLHCGRHDRFSCRLLTEYKIHRWIFLCSIACPSVAQDESIKEALVLISKTNSSFLLCRDMSFNLNELFNSTTAKWASKTFNEWYDATNCKRNRKLKDLVEYHEQCIQQNCRSLSRVYYRLIDGNFATADDCLVALKRMSDCLKWRAVHGFIEQLLPPNSEPYSTNANTFLKCVDHSSSKRPFLIPMMVADVNDTVKLLKKYYNEISIIFDRLIKAECTHFNDDVIAKPLIILLLNGSNLQDIELDWLRIQVLISSKSLSNYQQINYGRLGDAIGWYRLIHPDFDPCCYLDLAPLVFNLRSFEQIYDQELADAKSCNLHAYVITVSHSVQQAFHHFCHEETLQLNNLCFRLQQRFLIAFVKAINNATIQTDKVNYALIHSYNGSIYRFMRDPEYQKTCIPDFILGQLRARCLKRLASVTFQTSLLPPFYLHFVYHGLITSLSSLQCLYTGSRQNKVVLVNEQTFLKLCKGVFSSSSRVIPTLIELYSNWYTDRFLNLCAAGKVLYVPSVQVFRSIGHGDRIDAELFTGVNNLKFLAYCIGVDGLWKIAQSLENILLREAHLVKELRLDIDVKEARRICERLLIIGSITILLDQIQAAISATLIESSCHYYPPDQRYVIKKTTGQSSSSQNLTIISALTFAWCRARSEALGQFSNAMMSSAYCLSRAVSFLTNDNSDSMDRLFELMTLVALNHSCGRRLCEHRMLMLVSDIAPKNVIGITPLGLIRKLDFLRQDIS
ncbi:hypothetical protein ACOME3_008762 [Neoechinorhynchus agilis]